MIRSPRAQAFRDGRELPRPDRRPFHASYDLTVIEVGGVVRRADGAPESPGWSLFGNARACPHREPIPKAERIGCGCSHRCAAGHGNQPGGGTDVVNCWNCPIAPRREPADG